MGHSRRQLVFQRPAEPCLNCPCGQIPPSPLSMALDTKNSIEKRVGASTRRGWRTGGGRGGEPQHHHCMDVDGRRCSCLSATCIKCPRAPGPTLTSGAVAGTGVPELGLSPTVASRILAPSTPELLYRSPSVYVEHSPEIQVTLLRAKVGPRGREMWRKAARPVLLADSSGRGSVASQQVPMRSRLLETGVIWTHWPSGASPLPSPSFLLPGAGSRISHLHTRPGFCPASSFLVTPLWGARGVVRSLRWGHRVLPGHGTTLPSD